MPCFVKMFLCFRVKYACACPQEGGANISINRKGEATTRPHLSVYYCPRAEPIASSAVYTIAFKHKHLKEDKNGPRSHRT